MGKISYEDKAQIESLRKLGFGYRTTVVKFPEKGWEGWFAQWKYWLMSVGQQRNESQVAVGRKRLKTARTEENVRYLISENRTLTLMLRHFAKY